MLGAADAVTSARLLDIAGCLDDTPRSGQAFDGLLAWRQAQVAYRLAKRAGR